MAFRSCFVLFLLLMGAAGRAADPARFIAAYSFDPLVGEPHGNAPACSGSTWWTASGTRN